MSNCAFDASAFPYSMCGWAVSGKNKWERGTKTPSSGTGAAQAQSGKWFMYLETTGGHHTDTSYLTSPTLPAGARFMSFWYHMHGQTMGTLSVEAFIDRNQSWVATGWALSGQQHTAQAHAWTLANLTLPSGATKARFVGTDADGNVTVNGQVHKDNGWSGDISVDTVSFSACRTCQKLCNDGDVRIAPGLITTLGAWPRGTDWYPEVSYKGQWYPVCGHHFWDNDHGATTFCKMLGFEKGTRGRKYRTLNKDAMPVGACLPGQRFNKCTGGGHAWGKFWQKSGWCRKGKRVGISVKCTGGANNTRPCANGTTVSGSSCVQPGEVPELCMSCNAGFVLQGSSSKCVKKVTCSTGLILDMNTMKCVPAATCAFDGVGAHICGWTTSGFKRWTRETLTPHSRFGRQQNANSGTYFMLLDRDSKVIDTSGTATYQASYLSSPKLSPSTKSMTFYHLVLGSGIGTLSVECRVQDAWDPTGRWVATGWGATVPQQHQQHGWVAAGLNLLAGCSQVRFKGARDTWASMMAIDTVVFSLKALSSKANGGSCTDDPNGLLIRYTGCKTRECTSGHCKSRVNLGMCDKDASIRVLNIKLPLPPGKWNNTQLCPKSCPKSCQFMPKVMSTSCTCRNGNAASGPWCTNGQQDCRLCDAGYALYLSEYNKTRECRICPAGQVTDTPGIGAVRCKTCNPGHQPNQNQTQCQKCQGLTYSKFGLECQPCRGIVDAKRLSCKACDLPGQGPNTLGTACVCQRGHFDRSKGTQCYRHDYIPPRQPTSHDIKCMPCKDLNARVSECAADDEQCNDDCVNAILCDDTSFHVAKGWLQVNRSDGKSSIFRCQPDEACSNNSCYKGYEGVLCGVCSQGYRRASDRTCIACDTTNTWFGIIVLLLILATIFVVLATVDRWFDYASTLRELSGLIQDLNIKAILKILVATLQIIAGFASRLNLQMPRAFQILLDWLAVFTFDVTGVLGLGCLISDTYAASLTIRCGLVVVMVLLVAGMHFVERNRAPDEAKLRKFFSAVDKDGGGLTASEVADVVLAIDNNRSVAHGDIEVMFTTADVDDSGHLTFDEFCKAYHDEVGLGQLLKQARATRANEDALGRVFLLIFLVYPGLTSYIFDIFICRDLGAGITPESVLEVDQSIDCNTTQWVRNGVGALLVIIWPIGLPAALLMSMLRVREAFISGDHDTTRMFDFVVQDYKPQYWYWEVVELMRKLLLAGLITVVGRGTVAQVLIAAFIAACFLALTINNKPYRVPKLNTIKTFSEVQIFIVLSLSVVLQSIQRPDLRGEVITKTGYGLIQMFVTLAITPAVIWLILYNVRQQAAPLKMPSIEIMSAELDGLKLGALSTRATNDGVDAAKLEHALDHDNPKAAIIELILHIHTARRSNTGVDQTRFSQHADHRIEKNPLHDND